jgi:hypothetical protein
MKINNRELNKKVRELYVEKVNMEGYDGKKSVKYNCERYNNELCNGYKIVWKSYGWFGYEKVWKYIVEEINKIDSGWVLLESASWRGDGNVWGMSKEYRNLELTK